MRTRLMISALIVAAAAATVAFADAPKGGAAAAPAAAKAAAGSTEMKDLKWVQFSPDPKGPYAAWTIGDGKGTGPQQFILRVPAGYKAGEHFHTNDYVAVVVSGSPSHGDDEKSAKVHNAGATWNEPGKHNHFDSCTSKEDCIAVVTFPAGPVDFVPVGADGKPLPPPAAPKTK